MPKYFFHSIDGICQFDDIGVDLPDETAARGHAIGMIAELSGVPEWASPNERQIIVIDEAGSKIMAIRVSISAPMTQAADRQEDDIRPLAPRQLCGTP